jgi:hypothetical protein
LRSVATAESATNALATLLSSAYRHLAIGDPTDDDLGGLAAAFRAAADAHLVEAPSLLILASAIAGLIDAERPVAPVLRALCTLAQLMG